MTDPIVVLLVDDDLDVLGANARFLRTNDIDVVVAAMKLGAVEFLEKPIAPENLLSVITGFRNSHHGTAANQRHAFDALDHGYSLKMRVLAYEKYLIESCLLQHDGDVANVLDALQINRRTLNDKMSKLGIRRDALLAVSLQVK
jgi:two-component system C4-dicarboxylate transport response regulator DctD